MKTKLTVSLVLVVLLTALLGSVMASITGGIAAVNAKKQIIYYDFATQEKKNLLDGIPGAFCDGQFAIDNGRTVLIWQQAGKFFIRKLPNGIPVELLGQIQDARKIAVSSQGTHNLKGIKISFEFTKAGTSWVQVPPTDNLYRSWVGGRRERMPYADWPMFIKLHDTCNAIHISNVDVNVVHADSIMSASAAILRHRISDAFACGNLVEYPPTLQFKTDRASYGADQEPPVSMMRGSGYLLDPFNYFSAYGPSGMLKLTIDDSFPRFSIKREAFLGRWSLNPTNEKNQLFAYVLKTKAGCKIGILGRNEVPLANLGHIRGNDLKRKPGIYEIQGALDECQGVFWKPDGSLTVLSKNRLFSLSGEEISAGIEASGIANPPDRRGPPVPIANVFSIKPTLVANGIEGYDIWWVSNDAFIFRGADGGLYTWEKGETELILKSVPAEFSYCNPTADMNAQTLATASDPNGQTVEMKGEEFSSGGGTAEMDGEEFCIAGSAGIYTAIIIEKSSAKGRFVASALYIKVAGFHKQEDLEYALLKPDEIHPWQIVDPKAFAYTKGAPEQKKGKLQGFIRIQLNQPISLRRGNSCSALELTGSTAEKKAGSRVYTNTNKMKYDVQNWNDSSKLRIASRISSGEKTTSLK